MAKPSCYPSRTALWNHTQIELGIAALEQAKALGGRAEPYALQAAIAACHASAARAEDTDWVAIVALYDSLLRSKPSPIVELNRAVAVSMAYGPAAGLAAVDAIDGLATYHLLPSVRGDLLLRLGRGAEARHELQRARTLATNAREITLLTTKLNSIAETGTDESAS